MAIVTLLTDFGVGDAYVGMMKGVILSVNPASTVVDITHHIDPQDITQAAYIIKSSFSYFPEGTVHLVVVDPGVGSDRSIIAMEIRNHFFVAPDNGVLSILMHEEKIDDIIRIENQNYFLKSVSRTFHGRDIFAPVGACISKGVDLRELGTAVNRDQLVCPDIRKPIISEKGELVGAIVFIDRFGNLITNMDLKRLEIFCKTDTENRLLVLIGEERISGLSTYYGQAEPNCPLAIIGSLGYLEIAVNCGNARSYFKAEKGDIVRVMTTEP
ncbi:S-adenosyl-l-methionine hydroxide adenosyltransferase family protein [Thermodesulfobacteriota bacterium]